MAKDTFFHWAKKKYALSDNDNKIIFDTSTQFGEFVYKMVSDKNFPWFHGKNKRQLTIVYPTIVTQHMIENKYGGEGLITFVQLYTDYVNNYLEKPYTITGENFSKQEQEKAAQS